MPGSFSRARSDTAHGLEVGRPALLLDDEHGGREDPGREALSGGLRRHALLGVGREAADRREAELGLGQTLAGERDEPQGDGEDDQRDRLGRGELGEAVGPGVGTPGALSARLVRLHGCGRGRAKARRARGRRLRAAPGRG